MEKRTVRIIVAIVVLALAAGYAGYHFLPLKRDFTASNGVRYQGDVKKGRCHGYCQVTFPIGSNSNDIMSYAGDFVEGRFHGQGTIIWRDGIKYEGEFKNGDINGRGVMTYPPGNSDGLLYYEGDFVRSGFEGRGIAVWEDGRRCEGEFKDNQVSGRAFMTFAPSDPDRLLSYEGEFEEGRFEGRGVMIWIDGTRYEGRWRDNQINGRGRMTYAPGNPYLLESYEGDFVHGSPSGRGLMKWIGELGEYEGELLNGQMHGRGVMTLKNGRKYDGTWENGRRYDGVEYDAEGRKMAVFVEGHSQKAAGGRESSPKGTR